METFHANVCHNLAYKLFTRYLSYRKSKLWHPFQRVIGWKSDVSNPYTYIFLKLLHFPISCTIANYRKVLILIYDILSTLLEKFAKEYYRIIAKDYVHIITRVIRAKIYFKIQKQLILNYKRLISNYKNNT